MSTIAGTLNYTVGVVGPFLGSNNTGPALTSIAITPGSPSGIMVGDSLQFTATGTYANSTTANLTGAVTWNSDTPSVATFNANGTGGGLLTGVAPGTTNITASYGGVTSPSVSQRVTFAADFTKATLPAGITATRDAGAAGAKIWPCRGQGSYLLATPIDGSISGSPIYEDRSPCLPPGWWNHRPYQNAITDPFNFGVGSGWASLGPTPYGQAAHTTSTLATGTFGPFAPDGKSNVYKIETVQPWPDGNHYAGHFWSTVTDPWASFPGVVSVWMKDNTANPGNISQITGYNNRNWRTSVKPRTLARASQVILNETTTIANGWQRLSNLATVSPRASGGNVTGGAAAMIEPSQLHGMFVMGAPPVNTPVLDADAGSVLVAGAQITSDPNWYTAQACTDLPLVKGSIGGTSFSLTTPANAVVNGELDVEIQFIPGWQECIAQIGPHNPHGGGNVAWNGTYFFSAQTPEGEMSFRYDDSTGSGKWSFIVRGVEVLALSNANTGGMFANGDQVMTVRCWYKPVTTQTCGVRFTVNGAFQPATTGSTTGGALQAPTSFYLLHKPFAGAETQPWQTPGMLTGRFKVYPPGTSTADPVTSGMIVHLGDSLIRSNPRYVATPSYVWTGLESMSGAPPIAVLAMGGFTLADQLGTWQASPYRGNANVAAVIIAAGVNDLNQGATAGTIQTRYQNFINDVAANNPTAKIFIAPIPPEYQWLVTNFGAGSPADAKETIRQTVNNAIYNGTITGYTDVIEEHIGLLTDTDGKSLAPAFDVGTGLGANDGLHYTTDGRRVQAAAERRVLLRNGFVA